MYLQIKVKILKLARLLLLSLLITHDIVIEAANEVVKVETRGMKESIKLRNLKQL